MTGLGLSEIVMARLSDVLDGHVRSGDVPGLAWSVSRGAQTWSGASGSLHADRFEPVLTNSLFRIAELTEPLTAVAALQLVEECVVRLDDPIDELIPELADRRVLVHPEAPLHRTVPARRAITVRDLLTNRMGLGGAPDGVSTPVLDALHGFGVGPARDGLERSPEADEWLHRLGTLPLASQPGDRWLAGTSAEVLGVLVARACGTTLGRALQARVLERLGMADTGFWVPAERRLRLGSCYRRGCTGDALDLIDPPGGRWSHPPLFESGGVGLVSTAPDLLRFATALRTDGRCGGHRVLSWSAVRSMTTDQLDHETIPTSEIEAGRCGWGLGVAVRRARLGLALSPGSYGSVSSFGGCWWNDPELDLSGVLLTTCAWDAPSLPAVCQDFWTCISA
ncbi:MAG: beta-lactamase family protein, partial [Acidimicrobiales bacterium]|nr:beta-lactamase family protein [Acidimicrobiales bacterium]